MKKSVPNRSAGGLGSGAVAFAPATIQAKMKAQGEVKK
jgi:hypothetical protein